MIDPATLPAITALKAGRELLYGRRIGTGPAVLMLHGGPGLDHHYMIPLAFRLGMKHEVILPDLPGHGAAAGGVRLPGLATLRERLGRWSSALDPQPSVVIGHSLGGWLALDLVRRRHVRPSSLVLLSTPAPARTGKSAIRSLPPARVDRDDAREQKLALRDVLDHLAREVASDELRRDMTPWFEISTLRRASLFRPLLRNLHRALAAEVRPHSLDPRVLILCGERDRTTPPEQSRALGAAIAGSDLVTIENAGHYLPLESPDATAMAIESFIASSGPRAS